MKLFLHRMNKNNKGMSLIELICAVAILGIATTAIGSAMVVSTQNYQRGTTELAVQKEAQTTTNLIGNLLMDAVEASYDDTTDPANPVLEIKAENITYHITYDTANDTLLYTQMKTGEASQEGVLAENVTGFDVNDDGFATNKKVEVNMVIERNGKEYEASYSTTARNGSASHAGAEEVANIIIDNELYLEPGQTYTLPIMVLGMSASEAGIVKCGEIGAITMGSNVGGSVYGVTDSAVTITMGSEAKGELQLTIATNKEDATTHLPLDTETVNIYVRRVNQLDAAKQLKSGVPYKRDAKYCVNIDVLGDYLDKKIGRTYDKDYINPRQVTFEYSMTGMETGKSIGDYIDLSSVRIVETDNPYMEFTLKEDMPNDSEILIKATAKHPEGVNKSGYPYTPSVSVDVSIENSSPYFYAPPQGSIQRGQVFVEYGDTNSLQQNTVHLKGEYDGDIQWYFRYKEVAEGAVWSPIYKMQTNGMFPKIEQDDSELFHPRKEYDIEFIFTLLNINESGNSTMRWPHDTDLLNSLNQGLPDDRKILAGWSEANYDPNSVGLENYGGCYRMGKVDMVFWGEPASGNMVGIGATTSSKAKQLGSDGNPSFVLRKSLGEYTKVYFDTSDLYREYYNFDMIIERKVGATWEDASSDFTSDVINNRNREFWINNINSISVGDYRAKVVMDEGYAKYREGADGSVFTAISPWEPVPIPERIEFYGVDEEDNEYGYIYFRIEE